MRLWRFSFVGFILRDSLSVLRLNLVKVLINIVLLGKAAKYIDEDIASATKVESADVCVIDPFEQRGTKTILVQRSKKLKPVASVAATKLGAWLFFVFFILRRCE